MNNQSNLIGFWFRFNTLLTTIALCGFAFFMNSSISFTQSFLGISLLFWIIDIFAYKKAKKEKIKVNLRNVARVKFKWLPFFYLILAWFVYRAFHIFLASDMLNELNEFREVWLFLIVPLIAFRVPSNKHFFMVALCLVIGGALTGAYNLADGIINGFDILGKRAQGFGNIGALTYTGTISLTFFMAMALAGWCFKVKKKLLAVIFVSLALLCFAGLILSGSRGGYLGFGVALLFLLAVLLKKKILILLPFLMAMPIFLLSFAPVKKVITRPGLDWGEHKSGYAVRLDLWKAGRRMWFKHPLLGVGGTDYGAEYQKAKEPGAWREADDGSHMHNDFINMLVLYGSIGFTIFLMFYLAPIIAFFKYLILLKRRYLQLMMGALASSIVLFAVMGLTQCHFTDEEPLMVFFLMVGSFYRQYSKFNLGSKV